MSTATEIATRPCRRCGKPIVLAYYPKTGRWLALDSKQTRGGRFAVEEESGKLVARFLTEEEREASPVWERRPHATACKPEQNDQLQLVIG